MPLYDYYCDDCKEKFEHLNKISDRDTAPCPICEKICKQIPSAVRAALDPISGDFPGATMKWENKRKEKMKQERKSGNYEE